MYLFKKIALLLCLILVITSFTVGCGGSASQQTEQNNSSMESSQKDESTATPEPPAKLTMFFGDAGFKFPSDVDSGNNEIINIVEKLANVDLEVVKPEYQDFQTKFNLMISSGELLDIVHCWYLMGNDIKSNGMQGAFVPLNDIIEKSDKLKTFHSPEMIDSTKASDGKIYGFYAQDSKNVETTIARMDLIEELNGGTVPVTPDEWYSLMKKQKEKYPDSIPLTSQGQLSYLDTFFEAYGVQAGGYGVSYKLVGDKVISGFEDPKMVEAVEFFRKLYSEKLLDTTFVTNKFEDWLNRVTVKDTLLWKGGPASIHFVSGEIMKNGGMGNKVLGFVPHPVAPGVEPKAAYPKTAPIGGHMLAISSKCKNVDAAARVIEAFISPELKTAAAWGVEGNQFKTENGSKVLNVEASNATSWRQAYGFMWQYWYDEALEVKNSVLLSQFTDESYKKKYLDYWTKGIVMRDQEISVAGHDPFALYNPSEDVIKKQAEARDQAQAILIKAIVGKSSMEVFKKEVEEYLKKYEFMKQDIQKWYDSNK